MFRRSSLALTTALALMSTGCLTTFDTESVDIQRAEDERDAGNNVEPQNNQPSDDATLQDDVEPEADAEGDVEVMEDAPESDVPQPECVDGQACTPFAGTLGTCEEEICVASGCDDGFLDCDDSLDANGCETDSTTVANCGTCGNACEGSNATSWSCVDGQCAIDQCDPAFVDADGVADNGCETRLPPTPVIVAASTRNHSMLVRLAPPPGNFQPARVEFQWEQPGVPRRSRVIDAAVNSVTIGPIERQGEVTFKVRYEDSEGFSSVLSESFTTDFVPAGWYNRSPARFFLDARLQNSEDGFIIGFGFGAHIRDGGSRLIPSRVPTLFANLGFDMINTPPFEGLAVTSGFLGEVLVTLNNGQTWAQKTVRVADQNDVSFLQQALVLPDETIYVTGLSQNVYFSQDLGDTWESADIPAPNIDRWQGMAKVTNERGTGVFVAGSSSQGGDNVVAVTFDNGDTWQVFDLTPANAPEATFDDHFAVTMLDEDVGFIGSTAGLLTTSDGWNSVELVQLPGQGSSAGPLRIRFDEDRLFGVTSGEDNQGWYTTNGGQSWSVMGEAILQSNNAGQPVWVMVAPVPDSPSPTFLMGNDKGDLIRISLNENNTLNVIRLQNGRQDDLIGVVGWDDFDELRAFTSQGAVLEGVAFPDNFSLLTNIDLNVAERESPPALNSVAASEGGDLIVAVGNNRVAQYSTDGGERWNNLLSPRESTNLIAIDISADGEEGLAIGVNRSDEAIVYEFDDEPPRLQRISNGQFNEVTGLNGLLPVALDVHPDSAAAAIVFKDADNQHFLYKTVGEFDAQQWQATPLEITNNITGVSISQDGGRVWIVGENQTFVRVDGARVSAINFERPPIPQEFNFDLTFITFSGDDTNGWFATDIGWIYRTTDGGETWTLDKATSAFDNDYTLRNIAFTPDHQRAIIVGDDGAAVWTANGGFPIPETP